MFILRSSSLAFTYGASFSKAPATFRVRKTVLVSQYNRDVYTTKTEPLLIFLASGGAHSLTLMFSMCPYSWPRTAATAAHCLFSNREELGTSR